MPFTFEIDGHNENVVVVAIGDIYESDIRLLRQDLQLDPDFDPEFSLLMNLTGVSHFHITSTGSVEITKSEVLSRRSKRAFVASNQALFEQTNEFQARRGSD